MSKARRSAAAKKGARTRKRRAAAKRSNPIKRRKRTVKRNATAKRRRRKNPVRRYNAAPKRRRKRVGAKRRRNSWPGQRKRHSTAAKLGARRRKRRKSTKRRRNPVARKRYGARRRRRNPGSDIMSIMKTHVLPVAASLYLARLVSGKLVGKIPGIGAIPEQFRSPALAALLLVGGHFATQKVKPLKKFRTGILTGLGINLIDKILVAFAPAQAAMVGLSDSDAYGPALADYVSVNDYIGIGATPIQDDITLSDYVQIGQYEGEGLEEDLGAMYQDLGMEMDLGAMYQDLGDDGDGAPGLPAGGGFANRHLGGVHRNQMLGPVAAKRYMAPVPARSFTKPVPHFGEGFDKPDRLYTGIFNGGGC